MVRRAAMEAGAATRRMTMMSPLAAQLACRTTRVKKGNSEPSLKRKKAWMEETMRWRILGTMMTIPKRLIEMMRIIRI